MTLVACNSPKKEVKTKERVRIENEYLGETPPDSLAKPFAPGRVSTDGWEYSGVFNPEMDEFYFLRESEDGEGIVFVLLEKTQNEWVEKILSASKGQPYVSPDGQRMHLGKRYMEREDNYWSDAKLLGNPFEDYSIMRLTASMKGTYFFDEFKPDLTGDIRFSRWVNGTYEEPQLLDKKINSGKSFHPFIAPDESFLIFDSTREGGFGDSDIYISYRQSDGSWGTPINLGEKVNTNAWEASATVTPDGKYLFFNRMVGPKEEGNVDIFWVSLDAIEAVKKL